MVSYHTQFKKSHVKKKYHTYIIKSPLSPSVPLSSGTARAKPSLPPPPLLILRTDARPRTTNVHIPNSKFSSSHPHFLRRPNTMTAITRSRSNAMASSPPTASVERTTLKNNYSGNSRSPTHSEKVPPSASEEEAHARFISAVSDGVDTLMREYGYGRDRATENLLDDISDGCSPPEEEVRRKFPQFLMHLRTTGHFVKTHFWLAHLTI